MAKWSARLERVDRDGVRIVEDRRARLVVRVVGAVAAVVVLAAVVAIVVIRWSGAPADVALASSSTSPPAPRAPEATLPPLPAAVAGPEGAPRERVAVTPRRRDPAAATNAPLPPANVGTLGAKDAILALRAAGEQGGIAAFGLPGTDPPRPGVVVPDDFELPAGYVRHYQTTDDGRQLPPILTVHPDYELVDAQGRVVPLGPDRAVPPELAPPGMPVRTLDVPEPHVDGTDPGFRR